MHHGPSARGSFSTTSHPTHGHAADHFGLPTCHIPQAAVEARKGRPEIALGIQNIHWEPKGAYTGEHSARMALAAGARYVLVGHSEGRHVFGETDEEVGKKVSAALSEGLTPSLRR